MADVILPTGGGADKQSPIFVREGTLVSMHFHALHRRPDLWGPDASEFRPERWADEREITPWVCCCTAECLRNSVLALPQIKQLSPCQNKEGNGEREQENKR